MTYNAQEQDNTWTTRSLGLIYVCLATGAQHKGLMTRTYRERSRVAVNNYPELQNMGPMKEGAGSVAGMQRPHATNSRWPASCTPTLTKETGNGSSHPLESPQPSGTQPQTRNSANTVARLPGSCNRLRALARDAPASMLPARA